MRKREQSSEPWQLRAARILQIAAGEILFYGPHDIGPVLIAHVEGIELSDADAERAKLYDKLLEFVGKASLSIHWLAHRSSRGNCEHLEAAHMRLYLSDSSGDPRVAFTRWATSFFDHLERVHPRSCAHAAAVILRDRCERVAVPQLAARLNVSQSTLEREFRREYGMSPIDYHGHARVLTAIGQAMADKTLAVAAELGYASPKNFYRLFRRITGATPGEMRKLPAASRCAIVDRLRLTLAHGREAERRLRRLRTDRRIVAWPSTHSVKAGAAVA